MVIGILQFELFVPDSFSLKDKRRVVKSLKDRLHREHLVSVAEIAGQDHHRAAVLGVAVVSASAPYAAGVLDRVVEKLRHMHEARLGEVHREMLHASATALPDLHAPGDDAEPIWSEAEQRDIETSLGLGEADHEEPTP